MVYCELGGRAIIVLCSGKILSLSGLHDIDVQCNHIILKGFDLISDLDGWIDQLTDWSMDGLMDGIDR